LQDAQSVLNLNSKRNQMLRTSHYSLIRDRKKILSNISFEFPRGSRIAVIGSNGSGKTSLLNSIAGRYFSPIGRIEFNHVVCDPTTIEWNQGLGFCPDRPVLPNDLFVIEWLSLFQKLKRQSDHHMADAADFFGLHELFRVPCHLLSRGQAQRLMLAQAWLGNPALLILDEPLNGLDANFQSKVNTYIRTNPVSQTIVFSTHHTADLAQLATHVVWLNEGNCVWAGEMSHEFESIINRGATAC